MENKIINFDQLAFTPERRVALEIAEAGLNAIDTERVINALMSLEGNNLRVDSKSYNLQEFNNIYVVGVGKASGKACVAIENILGDRIKDGVAITIVNEAAKYIRIFQGSHPLPSDTNVRASEQIVKIAENITDKDLVITAISGGGSSLLCWPESELVQNHRLYEASIQTGMDINELNLLRKHVSALKGGGLAKVFYPATMINLIFSDIPGDHFSNVASGPTYSDSTTLKDAEQLLNKYGLTEFKLNETVKDEKYFDKVLNISAVSNLVAIEAMAKKCSGLGLEPVIVSTELYEQIPEALEKIFSASRPGVVVLAGGEPGLVVKKTGGSGGRCLFTGMLAVKKIRENQIFIPLASDGLDNSDAAGVVIDASTVVRSVENQMNIDEYAERFDAYAYFNKVDNLIMTGATGSNVSDLFILLNK